jgi:hypothetical protein
LTQSFSLFLIKRRFQKTKTGTLQAIFEDFRRGFINRHSSAENVNPAIVGIMPHNTIRPNPRMCIMFLLE